MEIFKHPAVFNTKMNHYYHFGISKQSASLYGDKPEDIVEVEFKIHEDQSIPPTDQSLNADYWGWFDNDKQKFSMIYPKRFLLVMCFPYGYEVCEERNQGKAYRLQILTENEK